MLTVEIDMLLDEATTAPDQPAALDAWLKEFAPECTGKVINPHGPAGGNPVVALSAPNPEALRAALLVWAGGDAEVAEIFYAEASEDYWA